MATPSQATIMDIDKAKAALKQFTALQTAMKGASGSKGFGSMGQAVDISDALGPLIDGAGAKINSYYYPRANAVYQCLSDARTAVDVIVSNLTKSIQHYENHETNTAKTAAGTATGQKG